MTNSLRFEILTPEKIFYSSDISSLVAPQMEGYFGVLAHHAPLIARSIGGTLKIRESSDGKERFFQVGPGVVEVLKNRAVFLVRRASEIQSK